MRILRRAAFLAVLLLLWQLAALAGPWPTWIFPGPLQVGAALVEMAGSGLLLDGIGRSLFRLAAGYGLALLIGIPLGLLLGQSRIAEELLGTPILGLQSLPSICWLPVALLWFGLSEWAILFVVIAGSVLSVALATEAGVRNLNPIWVKAARTLGAEGIALYTTVLFPATLPALVSGAKLGWTFAWRSLMAAELLYVAGGLGQLLQTGRELNDVAMIFAVMVVIIVVGLTFERVVFGPLERRIRQRFGTERP